MPVSDKGSFCNQLRWFRGQRSGVRHDRNELGGLYMYANRPKHLHPPSRALLFCLLSGACETGQGHLKCISPSWLPTVLRPPSSVSEHVLGSTPILRNACLLGLDELGNCSKPYQFKSSLRSGSYHPGLQLVTTRVFQPSRLPSSNSTAFRQRRPIES